MRTEQAPPNALSTASACWPARSKSLRRFPGPTTSSGCANLVLTAPHQSFALRPATRRESRGLHFSRDYPGTCRRRATPSASQHRRAKSTDLLRPAQRVPPGFARRRPQPAKPASATASPSFRAINVHAMPRPACTIRQSKSRKTPPIANPVSPVPADSSAPSVRVNRSRCAAARKHGKLPTATIARQTLLTHHRGRPAQTKKAAATPHASHAPK